MNLIFLFALVFLFFININAQANWRGWTPCSKSCGMNGERYRARIDEAKGKMFAQTEDCPKTPCVGDKVEPCNRRAGKLVKQANVTKCEPHLPPTDKEFDL